MGSPGAPLSLSLPLRGQACSAAGFYELIKEELRQTSDTALTATSHPGLPWTPEKTGHLRECPRLCCAVEAGEKGFWGVVGGSGGCGLAHMLAISPPAQGEGLFSLQ